MAAGCLRVTVLPDNDPPGQTHGQSVAVSCAAAGLAVKVLNLPALPVKGDISDWLAAGGTRADLLTLVAAADVFAPESAPAGEATDAPAGPVPYTFTHAFPPGHFVTTWIEHFSKQSRRPALANFTRRQHSSRSRRPRHRSARPASRAQRTGCARTSMSCSSATPAARASPRRRTTVCRRSSRRYPECCSPNR